MVPHTFFLRKPNRAMMDESELFYGIAMAEGVKAGLLTTAQLYKRFGNDGGVLSEPEKKRLNELNGKLGDLQIEFQKIMVNPNRNKEEEEKARQLLSELSEVRSELQRFEPSQYSLFEQTAERRARKQTILWWVLFISYKINEKGEELPLCGRCYI